MAIPNNLSFTPFDPLPASSLNDMIENDNALADGSAIDAGAISYAQTDGTIWWEEIGRTTLGSAGDTITVSSLPARKYLRVLVYLTPNGGSIDTFVRLNNDTGNNYARRRNQDAGGEQTANNTSSLHATAPFTSSVLYVMTISNVSNNEKIMQGSGVINTTGAANIPSNITFAGKWANTSVAINRVDVQNVSGTGDFGIGSEVVVLGHD